MHSLQSLTNIKNSLTSMHSFTTSKKYKAGLGAYIWTEKGIYHKHILIKKYFNLIEEILSFFFSPAAQEVVPDFIIYIMIKMKFCL